MEQGSERLHFRCKHFFCWFYKMCKLLLVTNYLTWELCVLLNRIHLLLQKTKEREREREGKREGK